MELRTLNRWLRFVGLVLVTKVDYDGKHLTTPTRLWLARYSRRDCVAPGVPEWHLKR